MLQVDVRQEVQSAVREILPELCAVLAASVDAKLSDRLLSVEDAADISGISAAAMRKRIARGQLPVQRCGRSVRVRLSDVLGLGK